MEKPRTICGVKIVPKWPWTREYATWVRQSLYRQMRYEPETYSWSVRAHFTKLPAGTRP